MLEGAVEKDVQKGGGSEFRSGRRPLGVRELRRRQPGMRLARSETIQTRERPPGTTPPGRDGYGEGGTMKITIEIPDAEVTRVLAPLLH